MSAPQICVGYSEISLPRTPEQPLVSVAGAHGVSHQPLADIGVDRVRSTYR